MVDQDNVPVPTDVGVPVRAVSRVPSISADQYSYVGKYAGALILAAFEQIGGLNRFAAWADGNPTDFYTKLMPKVIQRSTAVEHSGTITIDDAIGRLERMEEIPLEGQWTDVAEQPYDL